MPVAVLRLFPPEPCAASRREVASRPGIRIRMRSMSRFRSAVRPVRLACWLGLLTVVVVAGPVAAAEDAEELHPGAVIYEKQCAHCHGADGEGIADEGTKPLIGDRSVRDLTKVIVETMPADDPSLCVGEDAALVADYIYDTFYSEIAQARRRPAVVEFSRLTVRQYEESLADLFSSWRMGHVPKETGLKGQYFEERRLRRDKRKIERVDPSVSFDFQEGSPGEEIGKEEFSARWEGSVFAPWTGTYEFIVNTENGARLWVNGNDAPLIDAWVRSGDDTEFRGALKLLGGRYYPLRLEFFKFKEPTASIELCWKPPHLSEEVIPARCLTPEGSPSTFVLTTSFPPDDRSLGYEHGHAVSKEWTEATIFAALEVAEWVEPRIDRLAGIRGKDENRVQKLKEYCQRLMERAYRRPLSVRNRELIETTFESAGSPDEAVRRLVLITFTSPKFLYREFGGGEFDSYAIASWLSFGLWDSLPDDELWRAAKEGKLETADQLRQQAWRMLGNTRARSKVQEFFTQWLLVDRHQDLVKNGEMFPEFDDHLASDLRVSLDLLIADVMWSERSDFRELLTTDAVRMNKRLADFYGAERQSSDDAEFVALEFEPQRRSGVLTHPFLLSAFAYDRASSPIHRGVFIARHVLGRILHPPPVAVSPLPIEAHADLTTRERTVLQTEPVMCATCHDLINPLGFPLESFDAVGRFREKEGDRPVDTSGHYLTREGETARFEDAEAMAAYLAGSPEAHAAFVEQFFHFLMKQPIRAFGQDKIAAYTQGFSDSEVNMKRLVVEMVVDSALNAQRIATERAAGEAHASADSTGTQDE